jgi:hypothetical protein
MHPPAARHALSALAALCLLAACKPAAAPAAAPAATAAPAAALPAQPAAAAAAIAAAASPRDAVIAAMHRMVAARSYHADMHLESGKAGTRDTTLDFVAPDRFRMAMAGMGTQYIIGNTMYLDVHGRRIQAPAPAATLQQWRDPGRLAGIEATMTVDDQGSERIDGAAVHKYLVRNDKPTPVEMTLWVDDAGLPRQLATHTAIGSVTTRYSRFDDPTLAVEPPK